MSTAWTVQDITFHLLRQRIGRYIDFVLVPTVSPVHPSFTQSVYLVHLSALLWKLMKQSSFPSLILYIQYEKDTFSQTIPTLLSPISSQLQRRQSMDAGPLMSVNYWRPLVHGLSFLINFCNIRVRSPNLHYDELCFSSDKPHIILLKEF